MLLYLTTFYYSIILFTYKDTFIKKYVQIMHIEGTAEDQESEVHSSALMGVQGPFFLCAGVTRRPNVAEWSAWAGMYGWMMPWTYVGPVLLATAYSNVRDLCLLLAAGWESSVAWTTIWVEYSVRNRRILFILHREYLQVVVLQCVSWNPGYHQDTA